MDLRTTRIAIISHAGIKFVNRSVYRCLQNEVASLKLIIPSSILLASKKELKADPRGSNDPEIHELKLVGTNPRTYFYPDLIQFLNSFKPNVILVENDPVSRLSIQVEKWARRNDAKVICQTYENFTRDILDSIRNLEWKATIMNLVLKVMNRWMSAKIHALLVVNRDSEVIFNSYGYRNVLRMPLGYDKNIFFLDNQKRDAYRLKMGIEHDAVLVAYFGRLVKQKGVHILLHALSSLRSLKWMLLLDHMHDSENEYSNFITSLIETLNLKDRVIFFDADHVEIANYMRATDIMVAPSLTTKHFKEQYGRTVQEAMACGCVSLVSDSGHLKDLVGNKDLVFKEGNVDELSALLKRFITDSALRSSYSQILRDTAKTNLTTERQSDSLVEVINRLN